MKSLSQTPTALPLKRGTAAALALLALAGCAVGPDYKRPATALPQAYQENQATAESATPVEAQWWTLFQDATLNDLVQQALTNNTDMLTAVAKVEEADAVARQAGAALFPEIDLDANGNHSRASQRANNQVTNPVTKDTKVGLSTSFELDVWGRLRRAKENTLALALASRYNQDTVKLSLAGLVTQYYLQLRALDAELAVTQDAIHTRESSLKITQAKLARGLVSPIDEQQAVGALAAAQASQAQLVQQRAIAEHQLGVLTGKLDLKLAAGDLRQLPLPPLPPAGLPSSLLESRPDVRQAEENLVAANAKIGAVKATLFPKLTLTAGIGSESAALTNLFSSKAGTWALGLDILQPLFDAGLRSAQVDQVTAQQKQSAAGYVATLRTAFKEVNDALVTVRQTKEANTAFETQVQATRKVQQLATVRYQAGYVAYLDVLDAQRTADEAAISYITNRQAQLQAAVDLFKALGGGWKDELIAKSEARPGKGS